MALFKTDNNLIGIDVGTTGLRLVQVKTAAKAAPKLITYGLLPIDMRVVESEAEVDKQQLINGLKKLMSEAKVSGKEVVVGLPSSKVFSSLINLPKMATEELDKAVRYQAEQHVPMSLDQVKLDWLLVGEAAGQQEILLLAAPIALAERYMTTLEAANLEVVAMEPDALALARSLVNGQDGSVVVLDVGANSTDLVATQAALPKLIRSLPIGGNSFVQAAAQSLNLEADQAFQFVYKFGFAPTKMEGQVQKAIKPTVDNLVSELSKSINFFNNRYKEAKIAKIVLTGKASEMPDFPAYIANSVNLPVEIGNSWAKISTPDSFQTQLAENSSQFAVACGLALRSE